MYKEFPDSSRKIDAAYGLMLATLARTEALSRDGLGEGNPEGHLCAPEDSLGVCGRGR